MWSWFYVGFPLSALRPIKLPEIQWQNILHEFEIVNDVLWYYVIGRKQEIIKVTEQLIESINNGDFEAYA